MKKIVVGRDVRVMEEDFARMQEVAQVTVLPDHSEKALLAEARDVDTLLVGHKPYVNRSVIERAVRLKHVARKGVGVDNIDVQAATERGILVSNTSEMSADSVSEFTMSLLLSIAKNIPRCDRAVREGRWEERSDLVLQNIELNGKVHGIVGLGRIGNRVAARCKAFGMRVLYYKRNRDVQCEKSMGVEYVPFETLIKESDSISLHIPLTKETINLFDKAQFESMKRTALLINQARGQVVNEEALVEALKEGKIGGYATDVFVNEPPDPKSELLRFKNVVVSPHVAGSTPESRVRSSRVVTEDIIKVIRGDLPKNLVNREVLQRRSL